MKYKIEWLENKDTDWKIIQLSDESGKTYKDVSINRKDKNGIEFPNFDTLRAEDMIEGDFWVSPKGRNYLFPPKPQSPKGGNISKMMEKKAVLIEKAQDNKELGIMTSSTIRMAVDLVVAQMANDHIIQNATEADIKGMIKEWRKWLVSEWNNVDLNAKIPF